MVANCYWTALYQGKINIRANLRLSGHRVSREVFFVDGLEGKLLTLRADLCINNRLEAYAYGFSFDTAGIVS